ncbi:MAG TPA: glycosyl transferase family 2, partial [Nitrospiria bacterium]|nr:glycosyl transferase family 2 [Nitrospiria bacterium]
MAEGTFLSDELLQQLIAVGEVDILVGIPSCNNIATIGQVVRAVQVGFVKYFPRDRTVLINPDGGSTDGTPDRVRNASVEDFRPLMAAQPLRTVHRITSPYHGIPGRENALRVIFAAAELLRAKACAVVSADLQSITPEWIESLIRPVYKENYDLVTPLYRRHKFDGLLITNIVYPLVRAVYGYRVKEPLGGEFGFSGRLAKKYLEENIGESPIARHGIDVWMTTEAMKEGSRICQSFLGPKVHASKESEPNLADVLRQVVGGVFGCMESHHDFWAPKNGSEPVPVFGFEYDLSLEPARVNVERMLHVFRNGVAEFA